MNSLRLICVVFFLVLVFNLHSSIRGAERSLEERLANTNKYEVGYLARDVKKYPEGMWLRQITDKRTSAFEDILKTGNSLEKPYLAYVILTYREPYKLKKDSIQTLFKGITEVEEAYTVQHEWFADRYIHHSVRFKNTKTEETWTYNFKSEEDFNNSTKGVRFLSAYKFGRQREGADFVSLQEGIRLSELAKSKKLTAALVNDEGDVLSNEVSVDFYDITPVKDTRTDSDNPDAEK